MKTVRPKPLAPPLTSLPLSAEEGFVLSRIDGALSMSELVALTGLEAGRIDVIVQKLASHGAVTVDAVRELDAAPPDESAVSLPETTDDEVDAEERIATLDEGNYRKVFESNFHPLPVDARVKAAETTHGADLLALSFDPDARVVAAILQNPTVGLSHVRLIAFHHRTSTGLEMVARRVDWLRDPLIERRLLRNPQCGEMVLGRILGGKRVFATYKIAIDRDVPELTRNKTRGHLRQKFQTAPPEERADLVVRTEGRCLSLLTGCTFDGRTTQILCSRPFHSAMFIQNLARFTATPPPLLVHLMKQPFVRKNVALKRMLLQHPNMPGDVKRQG